MILYSKSGDFIGISKEELSFLGYEDLDEFKSMHKDVAELFVNKPGYIFKFKNFSWIDYTLHSGAPKKSVIIKLRNGNEVEVPIKIKELFLYNAKDNTDDIQYSVEFLNSMSQNTSTEQSEPSFIQATPIKRVSIDKGTFLEEKDAPEEKSIEIESFQEEEKTLEVPIKINNYDDNDYKKNIEKDLSIDFNSSLEYDEPVKLKANEDIFKQEEIDEVSFDNYESKDNNDLEISEDFKEIDLKISEDYISDSFNLKIDEDSNKDEEDSFIKIKQNEPEEDTKNTTFEKEIVPPVLLEKTIEFDFTKCAEELDLDISLIAELVTEYIEKIDITIPNIKENIKDNNMLLLKSNLYILKGISDSLQITDFSNSLRSILNANSNESKKEELNEFEKIVNQFKGEFI